MGELTKRDEVREYYGKVLATQRDLRTSACCAADAFPDYQKRILEQIDDEILERFYGCGSPIPEALEGATVVDLGCGTGRDAYMLSKLVGATGRVIGVDMTDEQIALAEKHRETMARKFGYTESNVEFRKGFIEDLADVGIADASVDAVVSNCVINLSPDKNAVFSEIFRVLKPGGELYFSDVFAGQRVPEEYTADPILYGECLAGAMYTEDFRRMINRIGCADHRVVTRQPITIDDPEINAKIGMIDFYSSTIRAFKLATLEDICEDYGQTATYLGTMENHPHRFALDDHHLFIKGKPMLVCGNTASMVSETRFAPHFKITGDRSVHYGPFDCSPASSDAREGAQPGGACC